MSIFAGSHKEQTRFNSKLGEDAKEIKAAVAEYNKLVAAAPLYCVTGTGASSAHEPVTPEQIFAAEFPWLAEYREGIPHHTSFSSLLQYHIPLCPVRL